MRKKTFAVYPLRIFKLTNGGATSMWRDDIGVFVETANVYKTGMGKPTVRSNAAVSGMDPPTFIDHTEFNRPRDKVNTDGMVALIQGQCRLGIPKTNKRHKTPRPASENPQPPLMGT